MFDVWRVVAGRRQSGWRSASKRGGGRPHGGKRPNRRRLSNMHRLCQFKPNTLHCVVGGERERERNQNRKLGEDTIPRAYNCLATATAAIKAATKVMEAERPEAAPSTEVEPPVVPVVDVMPVEAMEVDDEPAATQKAIGL